MTKTRVCSCRRPRRRGRVGGAVCPLASLSCRGGLHSSAPGLALRLKAPTPGLCPRCHTAVTDRVSFASLFSSLAAWGIIYFGPSKRIASISLPRGSNSITSVQSLWPHKVTSSNVLEIRRRTSLGVPFFCGYRLTIGVLCKFIC